MLDASDDVKLHKGRIEALCDSIFAVVLTLLVLELKVPDLDPRAPNFSGELQDHLWHLAPVFSAYCVTFVVGGLFWLQHHLTFQYISHTTPRLVAVNLLFFGFVSLLPFTMALSGRYQGLTIPMVAYFGDFVGIALGLFLNLRVATTQHLLSDAMPAKLKSRFKRRIIGILIASAAGLVSALIVPRWSLAVFSGVVVVFRTWGKWLEARQKKTPAARTTSPTAGAAAPEKSLPS
jgi:uncharacterized membrane protein